MIRTADLFGGDRKPSAGWMVPGAAAKDVLCAAFL
jgi:hypothetical protein